MKVTLELVESDWSDYHSLVILACSPHVQSIVVLNFSKL